VLQLVADEGGSMRMSDIALRLGIAKSSLHHVLAALIESGWIERDEASKEVSLGLRTWEVGQAYEVAKTLSQRAQPFIDHVRDELNETVRVAVLSGLDNVCIGKSLGSHTLVFDQRVGARLPAHATGLGKALLSGFDDAEIARLYDGYVFEPFTEHTLVSVDDLTADLAAARRRGWTEDNGEFILGIRCIAVPVRSREGQVTAALSVSVPSPRFTEEHQTKTLRLLSEASEQLSIRIAGEVPLA
jgi:DNA-binding IclR family transcriptional regulator